MTTIMDAPKVAPVNHGIERRMFRLNKSHRRISWVGNNDDHDVTEVNEEKLG